MLRPPKLSRKNKCSLNVVNQIKFNKQKTKYTVNYVVDQHYSLTVKIQGRVLFACLYYTPICKLLRLH